MGFRAGALLAALFVSVGLIPLKATTVVSYSYSAWASTATSTHDADFTHVQYINYGPSGYTSSDGFNITGPDGTSTYLQGLSFNSHPSLEGGTDNSAQVLVTTPSGGKTALLFLLGGNPQGTGYTITLSDGETWTVAGTTTFFGVSVSHAITSADLSTSSGSHLVLEDVSYGTTTLPLDSGGSSTAPEATTMLLLGIGLLLVAFSKRPISPI